MTSTVVLLHGKPYAKCHQCNGTGDDGNPPFCDCCFAGLEPLGVLALTWPAGGGRRRRRPPGWQRRPSSSTGRGSTSFKANQYPGNCIVCGARVDAGAGMCVRVAQGWGVQHATGTCKAVQQALPVTPAQKPNKFPGECGKCHQHVEAGAGVLTGSKGSWGVAHTTCPTVAPTATDDALDLSSVPAGRYAVPGGDTRLKVEIDRPDQGKWAGWIFVRDAAEYGSQQKYGSQRPGQKYTGKIVAELRAIMADPREASAAYGRLTGTCGCCGRTLEDEVSVANGIGPICARKRGWA
jgi:hypothetical protein